MLLRRQQPETSHSSDCPPVRFLRSVFALRQFSFIHLATATYLQRRPVTRKSAARAPPLRLNPPAGRERYQKAVSLPRAQMSSKGAVGTPLRPITFPVG